MQYLATCVAKHQKMLILNDPAWPTGEYMICTRRFNNCQSLGFTFQASTQNFASGCSAQRHMQFQSACSSSFVGCNSGYALCGNESQLRHSTVCPWKGNRAATDTKLFQVSKRVDDLPFWALAQKFRAIIHAYMWWPVLQGWFAQVTIYMVVCAFLISAILFSWPWARKDRSYRCPLNTHQTNPQGISSICIIGRWVLHMHGQSPSIDFAIPIQYLMSK